MKSRYKLLLVFVIILILFIVGLTIYKINIDKNKADKKFDEIELVDNKTINSDILDKEKYKDNIINDIITSYDYSIKFNNEDISGKIFIGTDKYLYITDEVNEKDYRISETKFKTMYKVNDAFSLTIYLISESNKLFMVSLYSDDINNTTIYELNNNLEVEAFTNLEIPNYGLFSFPNIVVLSKDGNMYDSKNAIRYESSMKLLDGIYYTYSDNTIANVYGKMLKNSEGKEFKIKYYIEFMDNNRIFDDAFSIIITEDNKILYTKENDTKLIIYNKTIKSLDYKLENDEVVLNLIMNDNTVLNLTGFYTELYGFTGE